MHYSLLFTTHESGISSCFLLARTTQKHDNSASSSTSSIHAMNKDWRMARVPISKYSLRFSDVFRG